MSEMYPPPPPSGQQPTYPNSGGGQYPPQPTPAQPYNPQQPTLPGTYPAQPTYPQQPYPGMASMPPSYPQQPPTGYMGYPSGGAPGYIKTNLAEYWNNARNGKRNLSILGATLVVLMLFSCIGRAAGSGTNTGTTSLAANQGGNSTKTQSTVAVPTNTPSPTATSVPSETPDQYKASATRVSVSDISKDPNGYKSTTVKFTAVISNFVQDSNGNTAGANVDDPNDYSSTIQIEFSPGFSLSNVNKGDTVEVWGQGMGAFSGTNAYGGTITEGAVQEVYLVDSTTGYSDNSVSNPSSYAGQ